MIEAAVAPRPVTPVGIVAERLGRAEERLVAAGVADDLLVDLRHAMRVAEGLEPYVEAHTSPESGALAGLARLTAATDWAAGNTDGGPAPEQEMLSGHVEGAFLEEGRFLRRVESPYVVPVYDAGELPDGRPYLVMAFADQGTLADRVRGGPITAAEPFTAGQALSVLRQVGWGLKALHDRGVLHRDVKPANVLFRTTDGPAGAEVRAVLGDLGLGKALDASSRLTMVAGTPSYVAPEQAQAESPDARADQYSLGALAYLLLSGRPAFRFETLRQAADPAPPDPLPSHPAAVDAVVRRALARDREERWQVRSPDTATANRVLDSVTTRGI